MLTLRAATTSTSVRPSASGASGWVSDLLHAGDPALADHVALATPGAAGWQELTYAGLDRSSGAVADGLVRRGVAPGQRVLLHGDPSGAWVSACLGILRAGAIAVPLDPRLTTHEVGPVAAASSPVAAVVARRLRPVVDGAGLEVDVLELESLDQLVEAHPAASAMPAGADRAMDDPALIVWTSGTTGRPKGVTLTYANLAYAVSRSVQAQGLDGDDRWLSVLPLNHLLELTCGVLGSLSTGATLTFGPTLMPREIVELLAERRVTRMMVVPLLARLLHPELERRRPGRLRALFAGGAPLAAELVDAYDDLGIPLYQGYGLTETAPTVAMNTADHHRRGSVGRPLPGTEVRIEHGHGGVDGNGEILVRSPAVMAGYWGDEALTRESIDDHGWLRTGDLGHLDGDGFLFVTGRAKELIVLESGKKVQPAEVEAVLQRSACFADVCVVGVASGSGRSAGAEQVCAVVVPRQPMSDPEVEAEIAALSAGLSGYKRPRLVDVWDVGSSLPTTAKRSVRRSEVARHATARLHQRRLTP